MFRCACRLLSQLQHSARGLFRIVITRPKQPRRLVARALLSFARWTALCGQLHATAPRVLTRASACSLGLWVRQPSVYRTRLSLPLGRYLRGSATVSPNGATPDAMCAQAGHYCHWARLRNGAGVVARFAFQAVAQQQPCAICIQSSTRHQPPNPPFQGGSVCSAQPISAQKYYRGCSSFIRRQLALTRLWALIRCYFNDIYVIPYFYGKDTKRKYQRKRGGWTDKSVQASLN